MRWTRFLVATTFAMGAGMAGATFITASTDDARDQPISAVDASPAFDGKLSGQEVADSADALTKSSFAQEVLSKFPATVGEWQPAEIEGQMRGAATIVTLKSAVEISAPALRPNREALAREYFPDLAKTDIESAVAKLDEANIQPEQYSLEEVTLSPEIVSRYLVVVDIPTMKVIQMIPMPEGPSQVAETKQDNQNGPPPEPATPPAMNEEG